MTLTTFFSHPLSLCERFAVAVDQIKSQERPMNLFIATDGHELCLWEGSPSDPAPRCVERESDVDPIVWDLIVGNLRVEIPRVAEVERRCER